MRVAIGTRKFIAVAALVLWLCTGAFGERKKLKHYTFTLPDKYVGWVQIIFEDPEALPLLMAPDGGFEIELSDFGIYRTSSPRMDRIDYMRGADQFFYRVPGVGGIENVPVPANYVAAGLNHDGISVKDTGGKGPGYSWFIFIGPPELRSKANLGGWDKAFEDHKPESGAATGGPDPYPTPGRLRPQPR